MRGRFLILLLLFSSMFAPGVLADLEVSHDVRHEKDFNRYQTFAWLPDELWVQRLGRKPNPQFYQWIRDAVSRNLKAKGYQEVPSEEAQLIVAYSASLEQKQAVERSGFTFGHNYYGSRVQMNQFGNVRNIPDAVWDDRSYQDYYSEGKLILDVYDHQSKELVWRATGIKTVEGNVIVADEETQRKLEQAVDQILKEFPTCKKG